MAGIQWYMGNISTRMAERGNPLAPAHAHPGREGLDHPSHRQRAAIAATMDKILQLMEEAKISAAGRAD